MMKRSKSLVALLLVLCMAMTFVVPATFAATETISFDFGDGVGGKTITGEDATLPSEPILMNGSEAHTNDAYILNCNSGTGYSIAKTAIGPVSKAAKYWIAIKLCNIKEGTFNLTLGAKQAAMSGTPGKSNVYIVSESVYNAAFAATNMATVLAGATSYTNNVDLIDNSVYGIKNNVVTSFAIGNDANKASYVVNDVTFPADGNYVMVVRTTLKGALTLSGLELTREVADAPTNPVAYVGETACNTFADALEAAKNGGEIKLAADIADAGDFTIGSGVTLDLNGKNLSAGEINVGGKLIDSVSGGVVTGTIVCANGNDGWLPLTNGNGKSLYKVNAASLGFTNKTDDSAKFGFNVHFEKEAAYALAGDVTIKVALTWDGGNVDAIASETFVSNWASTNSGNGKAIGVTVNGLTGVANFKLQPVVEVNGVTINLAPIAL